MCDKTTVKNMLKGRSCENCKFRLCNPVVTNVIISSVTATTATIPLTTTGNYEYEQVESCDVLGKIPKKRCCKFWKELTVQSGYAYTNYPGFNITTTTTGSTNITLPPTSISWGGSSYGNMGSGSLTYGGSGGLINTAGCSSLTIGSTGILLSSGAITIQ
jgi:hypothetical protein